MAERIPIVFNSTSGQLTEVELTDETSVGILTASVFSNLKTITSPLELTNTQHNYFHVGPVAVSGVGTVTVGSGVSYVVL